MSLKSIAALFVSVSLIAAPALAKDTLKVGVTTTGIPFTFVDTATQKPTGAMVDLAAAITKEIGTDAQFEVTAFSALVPSLSSGRLDLISAGMYATAARREVVDFSDIVYRYGEGMFIKADDAKNYTFDDLKGETVGTQIGTVFGDLLEKKGIFKEVKRYESIADIMRDVKLGRIKAGFGDQPIVAYQVRKNPELGVRLVPTYKSVQMGDICVAVAKGKPELLTKVNAAIAKLKASGELEKIFATYGL